MCSCISKCLHSAWSFMRINFRLLITEFAKSLGVLSAFVTILSVWSNDKCFWQSLLHLAPYVCFAIACLWAIYKVFPRTCITITFHKNEERVIKVQKGDIWSIQKGIVVIPVNNFLDIQDDDIIIAKRSLHGMFIDKFRQKYKDKDLDSMIKQAVKNDGIAPSGNYTDRMNLQDDKHCTCYPLGTVVRLKLGDLQYYLVVATEFDKDNHVIHEPEKYSMMILTMLQHIHIWNSEVPVYLPIIGSGQMGLPLTKQEVLTEMLSCFNLAERYVALGGTTILIYKGDMKDISLNKLSYQFSKF